MSYQLPPLNDEVEFERLVRDILRRVYDDPGIERFGREGQSQYGIDGFSPANPGITFQCKLKDTRYKNDDRLRDILLTEMEEELEKTKGLINQPQRFIFATTFKNDTHLQQKASSLSDESITVEYWGWDTINEKIWEYAESLIPTYYPLCPVRQVSGFRQITPNLITKVKTSDGNELNKLAIEYYRINDRSEVVFRVVCNDIDVRNDKVMEHAFNKLNTLSSNGTLWILGDGGCGKTTILHRLALELARLDQNIYMLNLETHLSKDDLETILSWLKYCSTPGQTVLCIDNPAVDEEALEVLLRRIPECCTGIHILLAERAHRYQALRRIGCLTYLHGEEELRPIFVQNTRNHRQRVYSKLFELLELSEADIASLRDIVLNERLVYVNATYLMLLELRRKRKIDFDFDWDDYRKSTSDLSAFSEGYKYIALFYLFGVRTPFAVLSKIFGADETQQKTFLERFRGLVNEPIILDEKRDDSFRKSIYVRTKHEIISEIFFLEHPELNKDELLMEWCEHTDFGDALEAQALINILGAKKNYADENPYIDFRNLIDFLLRGYLHERVALSPKLNATLHLARFWLLLFQNKPEEAITLLESFLEIAPENLHTRTELAKVYQSQGKLDKAEAVLLKLLELDKHNIRAYTELAKIYQRQNRLAEAEAALLRVLDIKPNDLNSRTELAKIYQRQVKLTEAEAVLLKILDIRPSDLNSRTELAKIYQRQGKFIEAEAVLLKLLELDKHNIRAHTELAKVYQRQNRLPEAEHALLSVLDTKANDLNSRTELAKIYQRQNKLAEAEAVLLKSLEIDSQQLHPRTELAKIYQRQGKLAEAEAVLLKSLEIDPQQLHPRTELAKIYQRQNKLAEAEAVLLKSLEIDPQQLHPRTELAKIYQRQGKLAEATQRLEEEIELAPEALHPRTELAKIYQRQNKLAEAEAVLLKSLEIDSQQLHPRTELAKIYQRQGKLAEAEAVLLKSLEIDPQQLHPRTELAKIYQRQNKLAEAEAVLLKSLEIDPQQLHPRTELAKIYQRQGKLAEATQRLEEYIELDPKGLHPRTELAKIYQRQGKLAEATQRLEEYIELDPKGLHPRTELAKIYQKQGKLAEAEAVLLKSLEIDPQQLHPRTELAKIYQRQGKLAEAGKIVEETLIIDPLNDHAMSELLAIWKRQREKEKCAQRFLEFIAQPNYRFSRYSQAPVYRFFQCCSAFSMKASADLVFERFKSKLDDQNLKYYMSNF